MVGKDRARGRQRRNDANDQINLQKAALLWLEPQSSAECHVGEPGRAGGGCGGVGELETGSIIGLNRPWLICHQRPIWLGEKPFWSQSLPASLPLLSLSPSLHFDAGTAAGQGAHVEADTEQKGWRSLLLKLCHDWQGSSSSAYFSPSILLLELQRFTEPQIHIHTNTPTHHSPNRDTQPKPLSASLFSSLSVSLSHTLTHTHALSLSLPTPSTFLLSVAGRNL